ncbi:MAG: acyltransferase [Bacteroidota bacterium]
MTEIAPRRQYYPALDGLRGLAILMVVIFHNFGFTHYFFFGWLGVDLFFVLSGFLITEILLKTVGKPGYFRNFYLRRILRIFPLYYLLLIVCLVILPAIPSLHDKMQYYTDHQWWFWLYAQNWLYVTMPPEQNNLLLHLWSLAIEEQFYIVWPLTILLIKRPKFLLSIVLTLLVAIMVTRSLLWVTNSDGTSFFNLYIFTRIDGICLGCALALIRKMKPDFIRLNTGIIILLFSALNFGFFFLNRLHSFSFPYYPFIGYTTFAILFMILVDEAVSNNSGWISIIFTNPILKFLGKISYGFYLIHWPVYRFVYPVLYSWCQQHCSQNITFAQFFGAIIATCLGFLLSIVSYYYYERRFLRIKERLKTTL